MDEKYLIPVFGSVPSLATTLVVEPENPPELVVRSYAPYRRFAVEVVDDGLDSFGLEPGDYAIFREQRWPNCELQICVIAFGDEVIMRAMENIWATEPTLRVAADKAPPIQRHRNDFIVLGVLDGVIKADFAELEYLEAAFDWGC